MHSIAMAARAAEECDELQKRGADRRIRGMRGGPSGTYEGDRSQSGFSLNVS
jgi:hypothetical protein